MQISTLHDKKILILGIGKEGLDNLLFFKKQIRYKKIGIADSSPFSKIDKETKKHFAKNFNLHFGKKYLQALSDYDIIVKSPGIPFSSLKIKKGQKITSQSDIFLSNCKTTIIGVTGTKGKSTVCHLLKKTMSMAGLNVALVGNVGYPALSYLSNEEKYDFFVYELSSFQLQTITKSPHIAIFLNIFKDHLDKHKNMKEYISSKENIFLFQKENDFLLYNKDDSKVNKITKKGKAKKIPFSFDSPKDPVKKVLNILKIKEKFLEDAFLSFGGLPHRKEFVGKYREVFFYNDSASTIPQATIKAIKDIKKIDTIIIGGINKGFEINELIRKINKSNISNIIILKGTQERVREGIEKKGKNVFCASSMKEAVNIAFENTKPRTACVLSPGFASFNMFKNYKERGEVFKKHIKSEK